MLRSSIVCIGIAVFFASSSAAADPLAQKAVLAYRSSTVFLKVSKITANGTILEEYGTGFIISPKGHILTSCHVVDEKSYDTEGNVLDMKIDSVEIMGAVGSRNARLEKIKKLHCSPSGFDVALLKFSDTSIVRKAIPAISKYSLGDAIVSLGYPAGQDFFVRSGSISGDAEDDLNTVDMTLNPGDSGGPVINEQLEAVAIVEGGQAGVANIGIVRPIRHAAMLLAEAGVNLVSEDVQFSGLFSNKNVADKNVLYANPVQAIKEFAAAAPPSFKNKDEIKVTYAVAKKIPSQSNGDIALSEVTAKPGYSITDARFIVTDQTNAHVATVVPAANGQVARAVIVAGQSSVKINEEGGVSGFIETTQVKKQLKQNNMIQ